MVALRGLVRSLDSNFGFEPRQTMLASTDLAMAGYTVDKIPTMQKRMIAAMDTIPGVEGVGLVNNYPPLVNAAGSRAAVFNEDATDLRASNASAMPYRYDVSPGYFHAAGTALLAGRSFSWHDENTAPAVAVVNREFARKIFGSAMKAVGRYYKVQDGSRVQVVGVVEDGKYLSLTEGQQPAIFRPFLQSPTSASFLVVRSSGDPEQVAVAMRTKLHELDAGLPVDTQSWKTLLEVVLFPSRVATVSLGVLGIMGAMLSITGIFGMAAYSVSKRLKELGIRIALGAQRGEVLRAALGRALKILLFGSAAGLILGLLAARVLSSIVYQATPRDPVVLGGVVLVMLLLGLLATWIPAQRALSLDPLTLLREE
jgi:predicted permease